MSCRRLSVFLPFLVILMACNIGNVQPSPSSTPALASTPTERPEGNVAETDMDLPQTASTNTAEAPTSEPVPPLMSGATVAISQIEMIDAQTGWAVGGAKDIRARDHVLNTADGGNTWKDATPPDAEAGNPGGRIAVGYFWDADTAWATYYSADLTMPAYVPVVWKTRDGGATWSPSAPLDLSGWTGQYRVSDLFFINVNTGWVLVHNGDDPDNDRIALYQTVNGGNTWERVVDPAVKSDVQDCEKTGIVFTGPWIGWLTGDCRGTRAGVFLFQTFDGGKSWIAAKLANPGTPPGMLTTKDFSCRIQQPAFFAQRTTLMLAVECTTIYTKETTSYLYSTEPSGWHYLPYPGGVMVVRSPGDGRVFRGDVGSGLVIGQENYIYNGMTDEWEKIGSTDWTGQFDFIDWNKGWAAARRGDAPLLMYTSDGGRTWEDLEPVIA